MLRASTHPHNRRIALQASCRRAPSYTAAGIVQGVDRQREAACGHVLSPQVVNVERLTTKRNRILTLPHKHVNGYREAIKCPNMWILFSHALLKHGPLQEQGQGTFGSSGARRVTTSCAVNGRASPISAATAPVPAGWNQGVTWVVQKSREKVGKVHLAVQCFRDIRSTFWQRICCDQHQSTSM